MKSSSYRSYSPRFLALLLLGMGIILTPGHSNGQAINACNLIPNPSFDQQNVVPLSGFDDNVSAPNAQHDEVTGWKYSGGQSSLGSSGGRPVYFATNAPPGSVTNPFTNTSGPAGILRLLGVSFNPYNYDNSIGARNGAISIITAINCSGCVQTSQDYISPTSPVNLSGGKYYSSFQAYHSSGAVTRLGMALSLYDTYPGNFAVAATARNESPSTLPNSAWTRVARIIDIPAPASGASTQPWHVTIGNLSTSTSGSSGTGPGRYHIDEVELYKIPTAGPNISCFNSSAIIGEGCHIPGATYSWQMNGQQLAATTLRITVGYSGTYTLTVKLPNGTTASPTSVTVTGCATLPSMPTAGTNKPCSGEYVRIGDATSQDPIPGAFYEWRKKNDPNVFDDVAYAMVYPKVTTTYVLKVYLPDGTTYTSEVTVAACPPPFITVDNNSPCPGSPITFTAHPGAYAWRTSPSTMFNPPSVDNSATFTTQATAGTGTVTAHTYYDEDYVAITKTVTVGSPPTPTITFTGEVWHNETFDMLNPKTVYYGSYMCQRSSLNLHVNVTNANTTTPQWHVSQMAPSEYSLNVSSNGHDATFIPFVPGYGGSERPATIEVTVYDACNQPHTEQFIIIAQQGSDQRYPCNDNDGARPALAAPAIEAYPNPASASLILPTGAANATLLNSQGTVVAQPDATGILNVQALPDGLYNLRMQQNGKMVNQHIEVKH